MKQFSPFPLFLSGIQKYEPGSIDVANCIGWKEACKYINEFGFDNIKSLEKQYSSEILEELRKKSKVNIVSVRAPANDLGPYIL